MEAPVWLRIRKELGHSPILEGDIGGDTPLHVERFLYQADERTVAAPGSTVLVAQFGGARVKEGDGAAWRSVSLPKQSLLVGADTATHWQYAGTIDFAVFYFVGSGAGLQQSLDLLAASHGAPLPFNDQLVSAAALQLVNELQKGPLADRGFMERLASIMLEQTLRALTAPGISGISPRHVHFFRLQAVLNHIHAHVAEELPTPALAHIADVSLAHFKRIFEDAMGMPPHRYIMHIRLELARRLLTVSSMPLARIAQECGFSSQSHLTASFRAAHAVTPARYRVALAAAGPAPIIAPAAGA